MQHLMLHPWTLKLRNRIRQTGLARRLHQRWAAGRDYEERFAQSLLAAVRPGMTVWDIGANIGHYTDRFLERGAAKVVCFEPAPAAVRTLRQRYEDRGEQVHIVPVALSDRAGTAAFVAEEDAVTNRLTTAGADLEHSIDVEVARADDLVARGLAPAPEVVKIDVEGYEYEVIEGFGKLLEAPTLNAVFIEVHFRLLHERGLDGAPKDIVNRLTGAGFSTTWIDMSHLAARRTAPA